MATGYGVMGMLRRFSITFALAITTISAFLVVNNGSTTTLSWALLLLVPITLSFGLGGNRNEKASHQISMTTLDPIGDFDLQESDIEPDDLPVL